MVELLRIQNRGQILLYSITVGALELPKFARYGTEILIYCPPSTVLLYLYLFRSSMQG